MSNEREQCSGPSVSGTRIKDGVHASTKIGKWLSVPLPVKATVGIYLLSVFGVAIWLSHELCNSFSGPCAGNDNFYDCVKCYAYYLLVVHIHWIVPFLDTQFTWIYYPMGYFPYVLAFVLAFILRRPWQLAVLVVGMLAFLFSSAFKFVEAMVITSYIESMR